MNSEIVTGIFATISVLSALIVPILASIERKRIVEQASRITEIGTEKDLRAEMMRRLTDQDALIVQMREDDDYLHDRLTAVQIELASSETDSNNLRQRIVSLEADRVSWNAERVALQARIDALEKERTGLIERIAILERALTVITDQKAAV